jgi:hypothetical protein
VFGCVALGARATIYESAAMVALALLSRVGCCWVLLGVGGCWVGPPGVGRVGVGREV